MQASPQARVSPIAGPGVAPEVFVCIAYVLEFAAQRLRLWDTAGRPRNLAFFPLRAIYPAMSPFTRRQFLTAAAASAAIGSAGAHPLRPNPPGGRHPWQLSASEAAQQMRSRKLTSVALTRSCLARIAEVNGAVNALNFVDSAASLRAARQADQHRAQGRICGPLHGIPVAIKDNTDVSGQPMTNGIVALRDNIARRDAPQVTRLRAAGAVLLGRSNTPSFSFSWDARNDLHGVTWNPWSRAHTPGGSSGGAACALATGMVPLAQGNDIGGSIRYPAYCCGIAGLRPTPGRVPGLFSPARGDESLGLQLMLVDGPMARSVQDLRLMLDGMSGFDPRVAGSLPLPFPCSTTGAAPARLRVAVLREDGIMPRTPGVTASLERAVSALQAAGIQVDDVRIPELAEAWRLWWLLVMEESRALRPIIERDGDAPIKAWIGYNYEVSAEMWGKTPSLADYMRGYSQRARLIARLQRRLETHPVLLMPVSAQAPFVHGQHYADLDSARTAIAANWSMMAIPVLGFPALALPTGVVDGLPTGVQLMGKRFGEQDLLQIGEVLQAAMPPLTPIDPTA